MSEAPEKIWLAHASELREYDVPISRVEKGHDYPLPTTEYRRADLPLTHAQIMSDPNAVHINMLRGTIAKPTVNQIIHLYGADTLRAALAQLKEPKP